MEKDIEAEAAKNKLKANYLDQMAKVEAYSDRKTLADEITTEAEAAKQLDDDLLNKRAVHDDCKELLLQQVSLLGGIVQALCGRCEEQNQSSC